MGFLSYCSSLSTNQPSTNSQHQHHSLQGVAFSMFLALYLQYGIVPGGKKKKGGPSSRGRTAATSALLPITVVQSVRSELLDRGESDFPPDCLSHKNVPVSRSLHCPGWCVRTVHLIYFLEIRRKTKSNAPYFFRFDSLFFSFLLFRLLLGAGRGVRVTTGVLRAQSLRGSGAGPADISRRVCNTYTYGYHIKA